MALSDFLVSLVPLLAVLAVTVLLIRRTGAFEQREHRKKVEELLERIAKAVEQNKK